MDFYLHDSLINDVCKVLGGIRYRQAAVFYYDVGKDEIDTDKIANSPVMGEDKSFARTANELIDKNIIEYFTEKTIAGDNECTDTKTEDVIKATDNAQLVRSGGRLVQIIGGTKDED